MCLQITEGSPSYICIPIHETFHSNVRGLSFLQENCLRSTRQLLLQYHIYLAIKLWFAFFNYDHLLLQSNMVAKSHVWTSTRWRRGRKIHPSIQWYHEISSLFSKKTYVDDQVNEWHPQFTGCSSHFVIFEVKITQNSKCI